jgi:hypothetical protein
VKCFTDNIKLDRFQLAFICPVDGCGRSFSVLSNMRRHARVHGSAPLRDHFDASSDDGSEKASPPDTAIYMGGTSSPAPSRRWGHHRRDSSLSASSTASTSSRHSRSISSDDDEGPARPGKRPRQ